MQFPTEEYRLLVNRLGEMRMRLRHLDSAPRIDESGRVALEPAVADLLDAAIVALTSDAVKGNGNYPFTGEGN